MAGRVSGQRSHAFWPLSLKELGVQGTTGRCPIPADLLVVCAPVRDQCCKTRHRLIRHEWSVVHHFQKYESSARLSPRPGPGTVYTYIRLCNVRHVIRGSESPMASTSTTWVDGLGLPTLLTKGKCHKSVFNYCIQLTKLKKKIYHILILPKIIRKITFRLAF